MISIIEETFQTEASLNLQRARRIMNLTVGGAIVGSHGMALVVVGGANAIIAENVDKLSWTLFLSGSLLLIVGALFLNTARSIEVPLSLRMTKDAIRRIVKWWNVQTSN